MEKLTNNNKIKTVSNHKRYNVLVEFKKCNVCNRKRKYLNESHICKSCYKPMTAFISSGNKIIDDFIKYTLTNRIEMDGKMEFVPYDRFKNIESIIEGGYGIVHKATWIDGPISYWNYKKQKYDSYGEITVALMEFDNNYEHKKHKELNAVWYYKLILII